MIHSYTQNLYKPIIRNKIINPLHGKRYRLENLPSWLKELCEFASFNEVKGYQLSEKKEQSSFP